MALRPICSTPLALLLLAFGGCRASRPTPNATNVGDTIGFNDSDWVVVEAVDQGNIVISNDALIDERRKTAGRFIQVHYKVTNKAMKEEMLFNHPKIIDEGGHEYAAIDMERFYVPVNAKTVGLETLQPGVAREFWTVIDVPPRATALKFQVHALTQLGDKKNVELGL